MKNIDHVLIIKGNYEYLHNLKSSTPKWIARINYLKIDTSFTKQVHVIN